MNQCKLYDLMDSVGSKVLSFEDFRSNYGSWHVTFNLNGFIFDVSNDRSDGNYVLSAKKLGTNLMKNKRQLPKIQNDELDILILREWINDILLTFK